MKLQEIKNIQRKDMTRAMVFNAVWTEIRQIVWNGAELSVHSQIGDFIEYKGTDQIMKQIRQKIRDEVINQIGIAIFCQIEFQIIDSE